MSRRPGQPRNPQWDKRGYSESSLRGPRVRILSGRWAGQEGHLMGGDYGFDGRCVKLDPQGSAGQGTYVEVQAGSFEIVGADREPCDSCGELTDADRLTDRMKTGDKICEDCEEDKYLAPYIEHLYEK